MQLSQVPDDVVQRGVIKFCQDYGLDVLDIGWTGDGPIQISSTSEGVYIGTPEEIREMIAKRGTTFGPSISSSSSIETSAGKVEGGWESVEIEERDPVEIMRMEGLAKADKDGIVPVTTELWNSIMDSFASIAEKEAKVEFERETEVELIEVAEEEISLMVQLELENKELEESLRKLSHAYKLLNAKFEVLQGGIG